VKVHKSEIVACAAAGSIAALLVVLTGTARRVGPHV
jgi:hypothetical protein